MKNKITPLQQRKQIYLKVLNKITPTKQDLNEELELFKQIEKKILATEGSHSHLEWCGSSARNTHLKGDRDLDLFVMFSSLLLLNGGTIFPFSSLPSASPLTKRGNIVFTMSPL